MRYLIGLGTNWQAKKQIRKMLDCVKQLDSSFHASPIACTKPRGEKNTPDYLNSVVFIRSSKPEKHIHRWCKQQEKRLGRGKYAKNGECEADFDLLASWNEPETPSLEGISEDYYRSLAQSLLSCWQ